MSNERVPRSRARARKALASRAGSAGVPVADPELQWQQISSVVNGFALEMPGDPVQGSSGDATRPSREYLVEFPDQNTGFTFWFQNLVGGSDDVALRSLLEDPAGALVDVTMEEFNALGGNGQVAFFELSGFLGSDATLTSRGPEPVFQRVRMILVHHRLYVLRAWMPSEGKHGDAIDRFVDSFTLLEQGVSILKTEFDGYATLYRIDHATPRSTSVTVSEPASPPEPQWKKCPGELVQGYRYVCDNGTVYIGVYNNIPIPCRVCGGSGSIRVDPAPSRHTSSGHSSRCGSCSGSGRCGFCGGAGHTSSCYSCGGDGRAGDNNQFCNNCSGTGRQTCWQCSGRGTGRCSTCGGSGSR